MDSMKTQAPATYFVHQQKGGTCYANACATVIRAVQGRILGRGLEGHEDLVAEMVKEYGPNGAVCTNVLKKMCASRNMQFKTVDKEKAKSAVDSTSQSGRAIVYTFHLTDKQWAAFSHHFRRDRDSPLTHLPDPGSDRKTGHAVVIIGFDPIENFWLLKNSWGDMWADSGYFKMSQSLKEGDRDLACGYIDVYFTESNLTQAEKDVFDDHSKKLEAIIE